MARLGESKRVFVAVSDSSWRVRQVVARTLAEYPAQENLEVACALLDDRSPQVQQDLLTSLDQWPLALAGPILLDALKKDGLLVRQIAVDKLAARWTKAETFAVRAGSCGSSKSGRPVAARVRSGIRSPGDGIDCEKGFETSGFSRTNRVGASAVGDSSRSPSRVGRPSAGRAGPVGVGGRSGRGFDRRGGGRKSADSGVGLCRAVAEGRFRSLSNSRRFGWAPFENVARRPIVWPRPVGKKHSDGWPWFIWSRSC